MGDKNIPIKYTQLFIDNEFVDAVSKKNFPYFQPFKRTKADAERAVAAAKSAFSRGSEWRSMDASARGKLINKLADLIQRDIEYLAALETLNNGKPYEDSIFDIQGSIDVFKYYAGYCDKIHGNTIPADGNCFALTRKEPIGVVGQIIPWNYPIAMLVWKWAPALAAGCTIVMKPAEQTPLTALAVAALAREAGFPKGVINVLPGYGPTAGAAVCLHDDVRKVAFTGSTEIGHCILEYSAKSNLKAVSLELGGKSPLVIFDDADVNEAVEIAHNAIFANHGQNCCAGSRTFVQAGVYDEFVKRASQKARDRKVGNPFQPGTEQGPQIDQPSLDKILRMIASGKQEGATLQAGGNRIGTEGYFVEPTVFSDVTDDMIIAKEEIFGPVQTILKFETLDEVIQRANNTKYGLAAGVITKKYQYCDCFCPSRRSRISLTPFGGYKKSGFGKDLGEDALKEYLQTKTISIKVPMKN
ncbi:hypothetical protein NQ317_002725 [Molorchus minor]|uniref:Aldehyde dehydrogenase domain-containing protein n=1 Tax=Molorchus minor TaxID=1323400 RepID=A0ABQ9K3H7_9CUCU|nr:hypothetical protein NQ317_002725 [Molorchus minor]